MDNFLNFIKFTREMYMSHSSIGNGPDIIPVWVDKTRIVHFSPTEKGTVLFFEGCDSLEILESIDDFKAKLMETYI